jgi:DNA repair exonuclease SbcCD ATPase subunit
VNLASIALEGFTKHAARSDVALPKTGIVLVTGENGAGKSSLVEAVSTCIWGRTLRGTDPWRDDEKGRLCVTTHEGLTATRTRSKAGKIAFDWQLGPTPGPKYETPTKAGEALEKVVGDHEVWRRTSVFSSHDAAHFTMATDAERKRFLESVLGLDRFDEGLTECREDRKKLARAVDDLRNRRAVLEAQAASEERRLNEALALLPPDPLPEAPGALDAARALGGDDLSALEAERTRLRALYDAAGRDLATARDEVRRGDASGGDLVAQVRQLRSTLTAMRGAKCPTCEQGIADEHRKSYEARAAALEAQVPPASWALAAVEEAAKELTEEQAALGPRINELGQRVNAIRSAATQRAKTEAIITSAREQHAELIAVLVASAKTLVDNENALKVLDACDKVLGMKGVRAHVLAAALAGLESVANGWLARLAGEGLRLVLKPYTETKKGTVQDALALQVEGAGGGKGYLASSGGERRRIDLALLLALADVASAAYSRPPGTLFADEVFDALDADGTARAVDVLEELSQDRCVVVLSHSDTLISSLTPALHLRVADGKIV